MTDENAFGKLIQSARGQRGWTQDEVAEKWGHTREYVSAVERGKRKLERWEEVERLADILGIHPDRLQDVGKSLPQRRTEAKDIKQADDVLFQALLEPSAATVKLSWLIWYSESNTLIIHSLDQWIERLKEATSTYRGQFLRPSLEVLAYAYEMRGKIYFDQLKYHEAMGQFAEMLSIGEELQNNDLITLAMTYQGDILRKTGRYETAVQRLNAAKPSADHATICVSGMRWNILARAHSAYGQERLFKEAIANALEAVQKTPDDLDAMCNQFNLVEVLQEEAQGWAMLWQPAKSLTIYQRTDVMKPERPLRDLGSYTIIKAQAHAYNGNIEDGVTLALRGLELAKHYHSRRHISRVQTMYDRLSVSPYRTHSRLKDLKEGLLRAKI